MTQRLTDDNLAELRHLHAIATDRALSAYRRGEAQAKLSDLMTWNGFDGGDGILPALLDEIEERRRIDARRLADAEQAFREECEAAAKEPSDWLKGTKFVAVDEAPMTKEQWDAIKPKLPPMTWKPAGKDNL